jgi:hypothetical protein
MSAEDERSQAHVDGYRAGFNGRPCTAPAGLSSGLVATWERGHCIGRARANGSQPDIASLERVVIDEPEHEMSFVRGPGPAMSPDLIVPAEGEPVPEEWP